MAVHSISREEFDALAPRRRPEIPTAVEEAEWFADDDRRVIGVLARHTAGHGWSVAALRRDDGGQFRPLRVRTSFERRDDARAALIVLIEEAVATTMTGTPSRTPERDTD